MKFHANRIFLYSANACAVAADDNSQTSLQSNYQAVFVMTGVDTNSRDGRVVTADGELK